jgi:anti-sigma28 factor (negative regulator of flagellin synthesis)
MKVSNQDLASLGATGAGSTQGTQKTGSGSSNAAGRGGSSDRVDFSSTLGSLSRAMNSHESGREAKVQALASQYQSGKYTSDSAAISRGIISEAMSK